MMNKRGQSMIEYALISVLVILGIVIMGPYVLRSVGAHFKLWDTSVQDSFSEKLTQANVDHLPNVSTNCKCTTSPKGCGSSTAGSQCSASQRIYDHSCTVDGCDGAPDSSCLDDPSCCTGLALLGCGNIPLGQPATSNNCNYGYQIWGHQCGSNASIQCIQNSLCPLPACIGPISPGSIVCPNEPPATGTLTQNSGLSYVNVLNQAACGAIPNCTYCEPNQNCQLYCDSAHSYFLNTTRTACSRSFTVAPPPGGDTSTCTVAGRCTPTDTGTTYNFTMCAGTTITKVTTAAVPHGQPTNTPLAVTGDGCQNPNSSNVDEGEPGDQCQVNAAY